MEPTREIYWNIGPWGQLVYPLALAVAVALGYGLWRRWRVWRRGGPIDDPPPDGQRRPPAGLAPSPAARRRLRAGPGARGAQPVRGNDAPAALRRLHHPVPRHADDRRAGGPARALPVWRLLPVLFANPRPVRRRGAGRRRRPGRAPL